MQLLILDSLNQTFIFMLLILNFLPFFESILIQLLILFLVHSNLFP